MSFLPPESFTQGPRPSIGLRGTAQSAANLMSQRWLTLHEAAGVVAALAGLSPQAAGASERNFPSAIRAAGGWRQTLAEQGVEDLSVILQTGITALLAVHAQGANAGAPARALWAEFVRAREALLALSPPGALERRPLV